MAAARRGMGDLLAGLAKTRSASELAAPLEGSHGTILRLDLAALGLTPAEWDARIAAVGSSVAPDVTAEHRLATALTGGVTPDTSATGRQLLVAADWMAQALAQPSASMPSIATTTPPASTTPSATTTAAPPPAPVRHLELAAAPRPTADILTLRRLHTRPVDLVRAAGELGQPVDALAARLKVDGGVSAWRAQRLLSGTLSRASWTDLAAHLTRRDDDERTDRQVATHRPAAVSPSSTDTPAQPGPRTGTLLLPPMQPDTRLGSAAAEGEPSLPAPTSPPARDVAATTATQSRPTAGPASLSKATVTQRAEVALWLDRDAYRLGDPIVIHAASDRACHLTVINVDVDGKATVIFPNAYQTDNPLDAATTSTLPGAAAPFTFKAREQGRETLIAICQDDATPPLGMTHDFERRRFTVLGNWRVYLSLAYQGAPPVTLEARPAPRRTRRRRKAADPAEPPAIFAPAGRAAVSYVIN